MAIWQNARGPAARQTRALGGANPAEQRCAGSPSGDGGAKGPRKRFNGMPTRRLRAAWPAYAIALLAAGIALVLRWGYGPVVHNHLPLLTMYAAVAFAAWYGGYGPGLLAATLGVVAAHFVGPEAGSARSTAGQLD